MSLKERQRNIQNRKLRCVELLKTIAAKCVVNLSLPSFNDDLLLCSESFGYGLAQSSGGHKSCALLSTVRMNVDFARVIETERISERALEHFVDAPVRHFLEEVVDVFGEPCLQLQEGNLEVNQHISAGFISNDEAPELEECTTSIIPLVHRKMQFVIDVAVKTK